MITNVHWAVKNEFLDGILKCKILKIIIKFISLVWKAEDVD